MISPRLRRDLLIAVFAVIGFFAFIPLFAYAYYVPDLASETKFMSHNNRGVTLLDRNNRPFFEFYQAKVYSQDVQLADIPAYTQYAIVAAEDKDFYKHGGFSIKAMARSFVADIMHQELVYGASTLTQQLVKNSLLSSNKNFLRKYEEVVLASEVERRYSKDQILQMYLSSAYFGDGAFGIDEAAHNYFNKPAKDLSLAESAMLAGLLPAPSRLSPVSGDLEEAKKRQALVLRLMVEQKYITQAQADEALNTKLIFNTTSDRLNTVAPHFALMVRDELVKKYGEEALAASGFQVRTTLDLDWQVYAEKVVAEQVARLAVDNVSNGAAVVLDPKTGEIRAMVGSKDWNNKDFGKFNVALAGRQPGSSFKPIVYVTAFGKGLITPATVLHDSPTAFVNDPVLVKWNPSDPNAYYKPQDFDNKFWGSMPPRRALSNSRNVPAVEVLSKIGIPAAVNTGKALGLTTLQDPSHYGLALALGAAEVTPLQLTNVYATFANNGYMNSPTAIAEIDDKEGNIVYKYQANPQKVLDEQAVYEVTSILSDANARHEEFGNTLDISRTAAVKTGTTSDFKDAWTLGYTPSLAIGVWVGNNNNAPMDSIAGSLGAAPIWRQLMEKFLAGTPVENFTPPSGMKPMIVCSNGGVMEATPGAKEATPGAKVEYFVPGTEPKQKCNAPVSSPRPSSSPAPSITPSPSTTPAPTPSQQPSSPLPPGSIRQTYDPSTGQTYYIIYL